MLAGDGAAPQGVDADLEITANGEATPATQALLFDPGYSSYLRDIAPGDEGSEALRVERRLNRLGYMDADPDETFDDYAATAAAAFRAANALGEGGVVVDAYERLSDAVKLCSLLDALKDAAWIGEFSGNPAVAVSAAAASSGFFSRSASVTRPPMPVPAMPPA